MYIMSWYFRKRILPTFQDTMLFYVSFKQIITGRRRKVLVASRCAAAQVSNHRLVVVHDRVTKISRCHQRSCSAPTDGLNRLVSMGKHFFLKLSSIPGWWFQTFFIFTPIWGRFPFWLYNIFQLGWNHQLVIHCHTHSGEKSKCSISVSKDERVTIESFYCFSLVRRSSQYNTVSKNFGQPLEE